MNDSQSQVNGQEQPAIAEVLSAEFEVEDQVERETDTLLLTGQLGRRATEIWPALDRAFALLLQAASCQWGCKQRDHIRENLIRRLANYGFGILRLARLGLYDESIALMRALAELVNLIELFVVERSALAEWITLAPQDRWKRFRPNTVQDRILATKNRALVDRFTYRAMCEMGVHVTPDSAATSHQFDGRVHVGGDFSIMAALLVLNELAIILGGSLKLVGQFIEASPDKIAMLTEAGTQLEATGTNWLRATNYTTRLAETPAEGDA